MFEKTNKSSNTNADSNGSNKEEAKKLFLEALKYESDENFLKATQLYQKAVKLYPNILKTSVIDSKEKIDEIESVDGEQKEQNKYLINILTQNFYSIIKFLDLYSMHRFWLSCKCINSLNSIENEYKRLCYINFINCEEKVKLYDNSFKRLLLEYPRIRHDGVYISCVTYIRSLKDIGNIHLDPKDRDRIIYNPCIVTYFRYLLFLNKSNKVLIIRSELNKKEVIEHLKICYKEIKKWNLNLSVDELIKELIKFQTTARNNLINMLRIGEYTYIKHDKTIEVKYSEILTEPNKYINIIKLVLKNYSTAHNNMLKWVSFKILSKIERNYVEDILNINNRQYRYVHNMLCYIYLCNVYGYLTPCI
ncbi:DNA replication origin binding protein, putative [Hepatocystis sp. ex Piliocolobus tephrosceles]|nr:DNA replication origin binding protein, putative [Hepatocystis sp. ex Piliocolobus tephrosceles]VWU52199.1 DNA replication origin binding protein, putative [Hepatocystis sp. ex Piliocolobus tephrosceles]